MLERNDAALVVIDFQEKLLPKIVGGDAVADKAVKLIRFARELEMPILWTEQYPKGIGPTVPRVAQELHGLQPIEKMSFGCLGDSVFMKSLEETDCRQLIVTGIETHVCVMQTALSALEEAFEVYVPRDAVGSRFEREYEAGLHRMECAGAEIVTTEMAIFEILREAGTPDFKRTLPLIKD